MDVQQKENIIIIADRNTHGGLHAKHSLGLRLASGYRVLIPDIEILRQTAKFSILLPAHLWTAAQHENYSGKVWRTHGVGVVAGGGVMVHRMHFWCQSCQQTIWIRLYRLQKMLAGVTLFHVP